MDVSVCIATYRRPEGLARLFASLGRIKLPAGARVEILVVDNDPDAPDSQPLPDAGGLPARRLREPERNIALARNRAVSEARGTWLAFQNRGDLAILVEGDKRLFNQYGVMLVNPEKHASVKKADGQAFIDWIASPDGQKAIADYKLRGEQLFFPNANQSDA